jgi:hypothetical protein
MATKWRHVSERVVLVGCRRLTSYSGHASCPSCRTNRGRTALPDVDLPDEDAEHKVDDTSVRERSVVCALETTTTEGGENTCQVLSEGDLYLYS